MWIWESRNITRRRNRKLADNGEIPKGKKGRRRSIKVKRRHIQIINAILGNPTVNSASAILESLIAAGVKNPPSERTIYRDLKDKDVQSILQDQLKDYVDGELVAFAVANITAAIVVGKDKKVSQWLLELTGFFPPQEVTHKFKTPAPGDLTLEQFKEYYGEDGDLVETVEFVEPEDNGEV